MADLSSMLPPVPSGPVLNPTPNPRHAKYVWHELGGAWTLTNGKVVSRGDEFGGADALCYEIGVADGTYHGNEATPVSPG